MRHRLIVGGALQVTGVTATVCPLVLDRSVLYGRPLYVVMMHTSIIVNTVHIMKSTRVPMKQSLSERMTASLAHTDCCIGVQLCRIMTTPYF